MDSKHNQPAPYTYAQAGVSIETGNALVRAIAPLARATRRPGATEAFADAGYPVAHLWWQADIFGLCREPDQRAVHVKEQGTSGIQRGGRADGRFDHFPTMPRGT